MSGAEPSKDARESEEICATALFHRPCLPSARGSLGEGASGPGISHTGVCFHLHAPLDCRACDRVLRTYLTLEWITRSCLRRARHLSIYAWCGWCSNALCMSRSNRVFTLAGACEASGKLPYMWHVGHQPGIRIHRPVTQSLHHTSQCDIVMS